MCGIAGIVNISNSNNVNSHKLKKMTDSLIHRGPDGEGFFIHNNIGLGHRRLVIIDTETGNQPMPNNDGNIVIVFNGEIYNYIELKEELIKKGYRFTTSSDTEVILKSYEEWGYDCQRKLNGMWAFAIYDKRKNIVFVSRDRYGEKPLFYFSSDEHFVFASEIKSLFAYGIEKECNLELLEIFLNFDFIPTEYCFFKNIHKLKPGHYLVIESGLIEEKVYYNLPDITESDLITDKALVERTFQELFYDSVNIRMRSDVPYGAFLSGGLDSSSVVTQMSEISSFPVQCFTLGNSIKEYNESDLAALVAAKTGSEHHIHEAAKEELLLSLNKLAYHYDEPFADSSAVPVDLISKLAANYVKMVLTGDGGDEVLSGYSSYRAILLADKYRSIFPRFFDNLALSILGKLNKGLSTNYRYRVNKIIRALNLVRADYNTAIIQKQTSTSPVIIKKILKPINNLISSRDFIDSVFENFKISDDFYKNMYFDCKVRLTDDFLVKVDRMSMANSIETRQPFLDHRLFDFMFRVDKRIKMRNFQRKSILRNTIGHKLPKKLLSAPERGFSVPISVWLNSSVDFNNLVSNLKSKIDLDYKEISILFKEYNSGEVDHSRMVWKLMLLSQILP